MKFKIEIKMDNSAFSAISGSAVAEILKEISLNRIEGVNLIPGMEARILDINGNSVGFWKVVK